MLSFRLNRFRGGSRFLLATLFVLLASSGASAQTDYFWNQPTGAAGPWDLDTGTLHWSDAALATPNYAWTNNGNERANFGGSATGAIAVTLSVPISTYGMIFSSATYTIQGSTLTLTGTGGVISVGTGLTATVSSAIDGTVGLTKTTAGTLNLSGTNVYTGVTNVNAGILAISSATALGGTADGTVVATGAALQVGGAITVAETLTLNGTGISSAGALRKTGANTTTWSGAITLGSASRINSDAGTLEITGGITGTDNLTLGGAGGTTISSPIAIGAGTLTKDGAGTAILSGTHTFASASVSLGVLQFNSPASIGGTGANVTATSSGATGGTVAAGYPIDQAFLARINSTSNGVIALAVDSALGTTLDMSAFGSARLGGVGLVTFNGSITPNANTYRLGGGGGTLTISSALTDVGGSTSLEVGLNGTPVGTVVLTGANTYTGATTVNAGVLQYNATASIGSTPNVTVNSLGAVAAGFAIDQAFLNRINPTSVGTVALALDSSNPLDFSTLTGANLTAARLGAVGTFTYSGTLTPNGTTYRLGGGGGTLTVSSNLVNVGGPSSVDIGISGVAGTVILTGANTFTGGITINGGILQAGNTTSFNNNPVTFGAATTGVLRINGLGVTIGGLATNATPGTAFVENMNATAAVLTVDIPSGSNTFAGVLRNGTGGTFGLTKAGAGTLVLSGANTFTGVTTVSGGVLEMATTGALGTNAGNTIVSSGAALQVAVTGSIAEPLNLSGNGISNGGALRKTTNVATTWSGAITLATGGARINTDANLLTISAGISGTGQPLTVGGAGNTTISGAITTGSGGTVIKDGAGTLTLSNSSTTAGNNFAAVDATSVVITINGGILSQGGESTATLGTTSYTGVLPSIVVPSYILINGGTLQSTRVGVGVTFLATNKGITLGPLGGTLDVTDAVAGNLNIYSGVITGGSTTGGLTKSGAGVLSITAALTYSGPTVVAGGTLRVRTTAERFPNGTALTVNSGAIFDINGVGTETVGSIAGAGNINTGSGAIVSGGDNTSTIFSGNIVQTAGGIGGVVTKNGTGTLTLSGNNSYSGNTNINGGTIKIGSPTALGFGGQATAAASTVVASGFTLDLNGVVGVNESITLNGTGIGGNGALINSNTTTAAVISDGVAGSARTTGSTGISSTTVAVSGGNGSGATAIVSLGLTSASFTINSGTQTYSVAPTVTVSGSGVATAVLTGGLVTSVTITTIGSGYSTSTAPTISFSGGTVLSAGTAPTGTGNTSNYTVAQVAVTNAGSGYTSVPTFTLGNAVFTPFLSRIVLGSNSSIGGPGDITVLPIISGAFTLTKIGAGKLVLGGSNTYSVGTVVSEGTLAISAAERIANGTAMTVALGATFDLTNGGAGSFNETIASLTGAGNVILGSATLTVSGTASTAYSGVLSGTGGGLTKGGTGILTMSGVNTYTGATTVTGGRLHVATPNVLYGGTANWTSSNIIVGTNVATTPAVLSVSVGGGTEFTTADLDAIKALGSATGGFTTGSIFGIDTTNAVSNFTYDSVIADTNGGANSLGFGKYGTGTLFLTGANNFTGTLEVSGGILNVASLSNYGAASAIGARLDTQETATGNGIGIHLNGGTLQYTGSTPQSTNRQIRIINGTTPTIDASGSTPTATLSFTFNGANTNLFDTVGTRTLTLTGSNTGNNVFAIQLTDQAANATSLNKTGVGTWLLTNNNTYTGPTTITGGALVVANTPPGSATGTGTVTVGNNTADSGTLRGSGAVAGPVNVQNGGTVAPGTSTATGMLSVTGNTTFVTGSTFRARLNGLIAGTNYDQLAVGGGLDLSGVAGVGGATLIIEPSNGTFAPADVLSIITFGSILPDQSAPHTFINLADGASVVFQSSGSPLGGYSAVINYGTLAGFTNAVTLSNFTPATVVPEPGLILAVCVLPLGLFVAIARRLRRPVAVSIHA